VAGIRFDEKTTAQIQSLTEPTEGYTVFNIDTWSKWIYKNGSWVDTDNIALPAKETLLTGATDSLYLSHTVFQSGADFGRKKLLRKNNGRIDLFPPSTSIPVNTVWRLRTGAVGDTISVNPANGYKIVYSGQTTGNAVYITGIYNDAYVEKVAADTLLFSAGDFTEYTLAPPTIYALNNAADPVNESNTTTNTAIKSSGNISINSRTSATAVGSAVPTNGTYLVEVEHLGPDNTLYEADITLVGVNAGDDITVQVDVRGDGGNFCKIIMLSEFDGWTLSDSQSFNSEVYQQWETKTLNGIADQNNPSIRLQFTSCADAGWIMQVDNIRITKNN
jgi:hypothetical protein